MPFLKFIRVIFQHTDFFVSLCMQGTGQNRTENYEKA